MKQSNFRQIILKLMLAVSSASISACKKGTDFSTSSPSPATQQSKQQNENNSAKATTSTAVSQPMTSDTTQQPAINGADSPAPDTTAPAPSPPSPADTSVRCKEWGNGASGATSSSGNAGCQCSNMPLAAWTLTSCHQTYPCCVVQEITTFNPPRRECSCSPSDATACSSYATQIHGTVVAKCP